MMTRLALASFLVGAVVGCAAYSADPEQQTYAMPPLSVAAALHCWSSDNPMPAEFAGMTVLLIDEESRLYILGREGRTTLIGEIEPGVACILSEGSET